MTTKTITTEQATSARRTIQGFHNMCTEGATEKSRQQGFNQMNAAIEVMRALGITVAFGRDEAGHVKVELMAPDSEGYIQKLA